MYLGMICYLLLPTATGTCALIPSHKAAAALALGSTSTGKVGSEAIALWLGNFSVFASVQKQAETLCSLAQRKAAGRELPSTMGGLGKIPVNVVDSLHLTCLPTSSLSTHYLCESPYTAGKAARGRESILFASRL